MGVQLKWQSACLACTRHRDRYPGPPILSHYFWTVTCTRQMPLNFFEIPMLYKKSSIIFTLNFYSYLNTTSEYKMMSHIYRSNDSRTKLHVNYFRPVFECYKFFLFFQKYCTLQLHATTTRYYLKNATPTRSYYIQLLQATTTLYNYTLVLHPTTTLQYYTLLLHPLTTYQ